MHTILQSVRIAIKTGSILLTVALLAGCGASRHAASMHSPSPTSIAFSTPTAEPANQSPSHEPWLITLAMTSPNAGWAIGTNGSIFHTTTSGTTWSRVSTPMVQHSLQTVLNQATSPLTANPWITEEFLSNAVAWIGVKKGTHIQIFRTVDGGQHWNQSVLTALPSTSKIKLSAISGRKAWIMDAVNGQAGSSAITLWKTADGGQKWTVVAHQPAPAAVSIAFNRHGVGYETGITPVFNQIVIAASLDGGMKWAPESWALPKGEFEVWTFAPRFDGGAPIVPFLLVNQQTQQDQWRFARLNTKTHTWSTSPPLPLGTYHGGTAPLSSFVGTYGWVLGEKALALFHHNRWHTLTMPSGNSLAVSFVTPERGWLLQGHPHHSTLWMTTDGGNTWKAIS